MKQGARGTEAFGDLLCNIGVGGDMFVRVFESGWVDDALEHLCIRGRTIVGSKGYLGRTPASSVRGLG